MVSTQQIGNLGTELSTASGLPKAIAELIIQKSLADPSWVIPFNTPTFPLYTSNAGVPNLPCPDGSTQSWVKFNGTGNGAVQNAYTTTSGKTLYLFGACVLGGSTYLKAYENDGSTLNFEIRQAAGETVPLTSGSPIAKYTSGQVVKIEATNLAVYSVWGVEI